MRRTVTKSWNVFLDQISLAREEIGLSRQWDDSGDCWYRGHSQGVYSLLPSLLRCGWSGKDLLNREIDLFYEFRSRARQLHALDSSWDILFAMQHYGVPTRVLDWTERFAAAVFFAIADEPSRVNSPHVWLLNPMRLNKHTFGDADLVAPRNLGWDEAGNEFWSYEDILLERDIDWEHPVALYPEMRNDRLQAQSGMFTIHGADERPFEKLFPKGKVGKEKCLARVDLPPDAISDAKQFLNQAGIHHGSLYPDLFGLARHIRRRYEIDKA